MQESEIIDEIRFHAEMVAGDEEESTPEYIVHGIYFGEGDPEQGGQYWNFTRSLDEDDDGVCTVKEIQEVVIYGGILSFTLSRQNLVCEFDEDASRFTKTRRLFITYEIDNETWDALTKQARIVFEGERYFHLIA